LWTKASKDTPIIRIPINTGIAGCVYKTKEVINILDAHQDERFNPEIDIKNNYRTKTILCAPIFD